MPKTPKMTNVVRPCYTMAVRDGNTAEITMYGEVVETRPTDWWTGEPIPGNFIQLDEFLADLNTIAGVTELTIHINSVGGDAYSSVAIHNRLREMSAHKTIIVDGVAMSGGSMIMCAGDTVKVHPSSLIMIHRCWSYVYGAYNALDLEKVTNSMKATDRSQMEIYKRKTGKEEEELLSLMSVDTTVTGREAIDLGFADELVETEGNDTDISVSADKRYMRVNGHSMRVPAAMASALPASIKTFETASAAPINTPAPAGETNEGGTPMPKTLEELRKEDPALAEQLMSEARAAVSAESDAAITAERTRLQEIDSIAGLFDAEIVREAKYGDKPCTAQEMAYRAAVQNAQQGKKFLNDAQEDYKASGADKVNAAPSTNEDDKPLTAEERMARGQADARRLNGKEEK